MHTIGRLGTIIRLGSQRRVDYRAARWARGKPAAKPKTESKPKYRVAYGHHGIMRLPGCTDEEFEQAKAEFARDVRRRWEPVAEPDWYPPRERLAELGVDRTLYRLHL